MVRNCTNLLNQRMAPTKILQTWAWFVRNNVRPTTATDAACLRDFCGCSFNLSFLRGSVRETGEDVFRMKLVECGDW